MISGTPPVSIFNLAMAALGEEPANGALTGAFKPQRLFIANWDQIRRDVLEDGIWDDATRRVQLAADPTAPLFGPNFRYALPADFLRLADVKDLELNGWTIEGSPAGGRWLLSDDDAPVNLVYIADVVDVSLYPAKLARAMGFAAAALLSPSITQSESKTEAMEAKAEKKLGEARLVDTQNDSPTEWDSDVWLRSRV